MQGITFDCNSRTTTSAIQIGQCSDMTITGCEFRNKGNGQNWAVRVGKITDDATLGATTASANIAVTGNYVHDNGSGTNETMIITNCRNSRIQDNYFYNNNNTAASLLLYGYCHNSVASGNIFNSTPSSTGALLRHLQRERRRVRQHHHGRRHGQSGITIVDSVGVTVADNTVQGYVNAGLGTGTGLNVVSYGGGFDSHTSISVGNQNIVVTGNIFASNYYGIMVGGFGAHAENSNIMIMNNLISGTQSSGIIVGADQATSVITGQVTGNR